MGDWRKDQSKAVRRRIWGQTRGQNDATWQDFVHRAKAYPVFAALKFEKLGQEMHGWRQVPEDGGSAYWMSCLRFADDGWGYWTVYYRTDERRWRATSIKEQPLGRALEAAAAWYAQKMRPGGNMV